MPNSSSACASTVTKRPSPGSSTTTASGARSVAYGSSARFGAPRSASSAGLSGSVEALMASATGGVEPMMLRKASRQQQGASPAAPRPAMHLRFPRPVEPSAHSGALDVVIVVVVVHVHDRRLRLGGRDDTRLPGHRSPD